jgi:translocation and assembly module TamB
MSKQARARLIIAHTLHVFALVVAFVVSLVASLLLNVNLPATRRFVCAAVTAALKNVFEGQLIIERVDDIGIDGIRGARARVLDETGAQVVLADGINANAWVVGIVQSAAMGPGEISIPISRVYIDWADVSIDFNGGTPRIAHAFRPRPRTTPPTPGPKRGVSVEIADIAIRHAWVHGAVPSAPPIDADANDIRSHLEVTAVNQATDDVTITAGHVKVHSRNAPYHADLDGDAHVQLLVPIGTAHELAIGGSYHGDVAGIPVHARASLNGKQIDASVEVPRVEVDRVQKILPGAPLADLASAHVEAHGTLDALDTTARAQFGKGVVNAKAKVAVTPEVYVDGNFSIEHLDARAFSKNAPQTDANATGKASIQLKTTGPVGSYEIEIAKGMVAKTPTPTAHVKGTLAPTSITATVDIDEPGAPTTVDAHLDLNKKTIVFDTRSKASLQNIPQVKRMVSGAAEAQTHGTVDLNKGTIDAEYAVKAHAVGASGVAAHHLEANGTVRGPLAAPVIAVTTHAHGVQGTGIAIESVDASATVDVGSQITVNDAAIDVSTQDEHIKLNADRVLVANGGVKVEGATVDGLGDLIGVDAEEANGLLALSVHAHDIDLSKVARVFGAASVVQSGRVSVNADMKLTHDQASGQIALDVVRANVGPITNGSAHVDAQLLGRAVIANIHVETPQYGRLDINTSTIHLAGSPLTPKAWTEATGDAQIDGEIQLKNAIAFLPSSITDIEGVAVIDGEIQRDDPKVAPSVELDIDTNGLVLSHSPAWRIDGVDVHVVAKEDGKGHVDLATKLTDSHGDLVSVAGATDLPVEELVALAPKRETFLKAPSTIDIEIPERAFDTFPAIAGLQSVKGSVQASVKASGTFFAPHVTADVRVAGFRTPDLPLSLATSGEAGLTYDGQTAELTANVVAKKHTVLDIDTQTQIVWHDALIFGPTKGLPWSASGHVVLSSFPLQSITPLADRSIKGEVSGELSVTDLHKNAHADVQLSFDDLKVGKAKYTNTYTRATIDPSGSAAMFRIDQADGSAEVTATAGTIWGTNLAPSVDPSKNVIATFAAKNLSAAVVQPFVDDYLNQLDGRVDATISATIPPTGEPQVKGTLAFRDGIVQSPIVGEEFHDVDASMTVLPNGTDTILRADKITAAGTTGKILASATARFHGVQFIGANILANIPKDNPIQLTAQGEDYGEGYGNLSVAVDASIRNMFTTNIVIPSFHVRVPEMSTRGLQNLDPAPDIRVGVQQAGRTFQPLDLGAKAEPTTPRTGRVDIDVKFGNDVDVRVGQTVQVQLDGGPHIAITDKTVVSGRFNLEDGKLDVQGKEFQIQKGGTVTFQGDDPADPYCVVTASWTAPDGTIVYADFIGPVKTGKVTLRSEPEKSQNEILALILFGTTDDDQQGSESGATQAASTAGSVATEGVNKAIDQLTGIDAQVRIDTSDSNNPKPEVQVQIAKNISLELATVIGATPFGVNQDRNLATIEWRFLPRWAIETTFGDAGTSVADLIWQYRY